MAAMLHLFAHMGITGMRRMPARLTVTTARVGSLVEYLSELDPGSTGMVDIGAVAVTTATVVITDEAVTMAAAATTDAEAMLVADRSLLLIGVAVEWLEDRWAVDSAADQPAGSMALAGSTAVAVAMAVVGTGN
ncbi:MAG TPA: hypothetical protein VIX91_09405 [Candidatus Acidoferrum sp.]